jgi:hypothetical protein
MQTAGASSVAKASADIFYGSEVWARFQKNVLNAQDSTSKGARTVASAISSCNGVVSTGTRLTVSNTNAVEDLNAAQEQQIRDLHGRMVAQNSLNGSLRTANDAELDYRTAVLDAKSAHKELNDLRKHGKQGTEEYARAEIAAAQADQQKADALNAMREAQHQANVATIAGTTDTANLTAAGQKYAENLNKATDELQKWKSKLDTVPKDKRTEVKAEIKKAQANVDRIKREIAGIKGKTVTLNVKATGGGTVRAVVNGKLTQFVVNASGGIWPARPGGYLSTIAEAGVDEAAIPLRKDSRSRALLAYASNAILGTPAGGNVFNISGSKLDAETIQQAVNRSLVASFGG